jgi:hypothetical protein
MTLTLTRIHAKQHAMLGNSGKRLKFLNEPMSPVNGGQF